MDYIWHQWLFKYLFPPITIFTLIIVSISIYTRSYTISNWGYLFHDISIYRGRPNVWEYTYSVLQYTGTALQMGYSATASLYLCVCVHACTCYVHTPHTWYSPTEQLGTLFLIWLQHRYTKSGMGTETCQSYQLTHSLTYHTKPCWVNRHKQHQHDHSPQSTTLHNTTSNSSTAVH